jgi:hypothetical protein
MSEISATPLRHVHLVQLLGWCKNVKKARMIPEEMKFFVGLPAFHTGSFEAVMRLFRAKTEVKFFLVYKLMSKGSLDKYVVPRPESSSAKETHVLS